MISTKLSRILVYKKKNKKGRPKKITYFNRYAAMEQQLMLLKTSNFKKILVKSTAICFLSYRLKQDVTGDHPNSPSKNAKFFSLTPTSHLVYVFVNERPLLNINYPSLLLLCQGFLNGIYITATRSSL